MNERQSHARYDTLHINLWGSPGVGKAGISGQLYGKLKEAGYVAMLVHDYAEELALQGKLAWREVETNEIREFDQFIISSEQYRRESEMEGSVEVVITDAPLLQQTIFAPGHYAGELRHILNQMTVGWTSMDVLLTGGVRPDYTSMGRVQTAEHSLALQPEILAILSEDRPNYMTMTTEGSTQELFGLAVDHLQRKRTFRRTL